MGDMLTCALSGIPTILELEGAEIRAVVESSFDPVVRQDIVAVFSDAVAEQFRCENPIAVTVSDLEA